MSLCCRYKWRAQGLTVVFRCLVLSDPAHTCVNICRWSSDPTLKRRLLVKKKPQQRTTESTLFSFYLVDCNADSMLVIRFWAAKVWELSLVQLAAVSRLSRPDSILKKSSILRVVEWKIKVEKTFVKQFCQILHSPRLSCPAPARLLPHFTIYTKLWKTTFYRWRTSNFVKKDSQSPVNKRSVPPLFNILIIYFILFHVYYYH